MEAETTKIGKLGVYGNVGSMIELLALGGIRESKDQKNEVANFGDGEIRNLGSRPMNVLVGAGHPNLGRTTTRPRRRDEMSINTNSIAAEVAQISEVQNWMQGLEKELCRASDTQSAMRDRVSSVLRDALPNEEEDEYPDEQLTPLAAQLRTYVRKLEEQTAMYESMLSRIEL